MPPLKPPRPNEFRTAIAISIGIAAVALLFALTASFLFGG